jgi:hypothetical protein
MEKLTIYYTENETIKGENNISRYIVSKYPSFLDWLGKLLKEVLGIEEGEQLAKFYIEKLGDELENEKLIAKDIKKMIDKNEKYSSPLGRVDIFYGKERVYMTLRKSKGIRKKFADFMKKNSIWIKAVKVPNHTKVFSNKQ